MVVIFTSPLIGPSALFNGFNVFVDVTSAGGIATTPIPEANLIAGSYTVTVADAAGSLVPTTFVLTNIVVCLAFDTEILMADNTWKAIQDIKRGESVASDPLISKTYKVSRINVITITDKTKADIVVFQPGSLGKNIPRRKLITSGDHTILLNGTKRPARRYQNLSKVTRYLGGKISKKNYNNDTIYHLRDILPCQNGRLDQSDTPFDQFECDKFNLYDIQFDTKGTYVAEGVVVKSRCPKSIYTPLPKDLYFDQA